MQKKSFSNKSFKKEHQGEKERQGLREDEICRKRASGIRASTKSFKGKKSVRDWAKTKFAEKELQEQELQKKASKAERASGTARRRNSQEKSFRNKSFKKERQGEKERQGLREDEICSKRASGIRASKKSFKGKKSVRDCAKTELAEKELQE